MNKVIILREDNLEDYMDEDHLIVAFTTNGCGACKSIIPTLYQIDDGFKVVVVNSDIHMKSNTFFPNIPSFYPTLAYFKEGKFIKTFSREDIKNKNLWN
tara:strand:+ start:103 stop:399 length:297 start_codon:yes stop_codon:yes gene_type:complete